MKGNILTPAGWIFGEIHAGPDGRIARIEGVPATPEHNDAPYVLPGFVDLLNHGGGGKDFMDGEAAVPVILRAHVRFGTTSLLGSTMTSPHDVLLRALQALGRACAQRPPGAARMLGVHLEGPYINPGKLGAQPDTSATATPEELEQYLGAAPLKVVTLAPELPGHLDIIRLLAARGVRVQLGHTLGTYEDAVAALDAGASGFTHLFNAMTPLQHRAPGGNARIGWFFEAVAGPGPEPVNREPDKCSAVEWFPLDNLPDDVIPYPLAGIRAYLDGVPFGLLGWADQPHSMRA